LSRARDCQEVSIASLTRARTNKQTDKQTDGRTDGRTEVVGWSRVCVAYSTDTEVGGVR